MVDTFVWHLWPGRHWPASALEEAQLISELRILAGAGAADPSRPDITAVLNALRCGVTVVDLLRAAPGIDPAALVAAYTDLEARRRASHTAWLAITQTPSVSTITEHAPLAAQLLPVPVYRVVTAATRVSTDSLRRVVATVAAEIRSAGEQAAAIEGVLAHRTPPDPHAVALGAILHNPHEPGLWGHPYFLPDRVGSLSPVRVADLLGERGQ